MANVNVRGLSDTTKEALRVRAAQSGLSLEAFARRVLQNASTEITEPPKNFSTLINHYFGEQNGIELSLTERSSKRETVELAE